MKLDVLKKLFESGALISATVKPAFSEGKGWLLELKKSNGSTVVMQLDRKRKLGDAGYKEQDRIFKSIDAAIKSANAIGFIEIKVNTQFRY